MDEQLNAILRARLRADIVPALDCATDAYNSFRDGTPGESDVAIGMDGYVRACSRESGVVLLTPDGVFLALLRRFASAKMDAPPASELTPALDAMPDWHLSLEQLETAAAERVAQIVVRTSFSTTNPSCRRAFALALLSRADLLADVDGVVDDGVVGGVSSVMVLGTVSDWFRLAETGAGLLKSCGLQCEIDRFTHAMQCVQTILQHGGVVRAHEGNGGDILCASAPSWVLDLCASISLPDVAVLPLTTRAGVNYLIVSALQGGRFCSEAVVRLSSSPTMRAMFCASIAPAPRRTPASSAADVPSDPESALSTLKSAISARDMMAALHALTALPCAGDALQTFVLDGNWMLARMLADRIVLPAMRAPAPSFDVDDKESSADEIASKLRPDLARESFDAAPEEGSLAVDPAFMSAIRSVRIDDMRTSSTPLPSLPRASLLRLQRWAVEEMILNADLDLSALMTAPVRDGVALEIRVVSL